MVIGVGGLGHMAVQILAALSPARIIAVDTSADKLVLAREVGVDEAVGAGENAAAAIQELTRGRGAELVIDMVGADDTLALAAKIVRFESHLTVVGLAGGPFNSASVRCPSSARSPCRIGAAASS